MNTRVHYEYRDGANYHFNSSIVAAGEMTSALWTRLRRACDSGAEYGFIAHQVGFPGLRFRWKIFDPAKRYRL